MVSISINNEQKVKITAAPTTAAGNPATLDGGLRGTVLEGDATVEAVDGEPNSLYLVSGVAVGLSRIRIYADADLGEGTREIEDTVELTVTAAEANTLGVTVAAAETK